MAQYDSSSRSNSDDAELDSLRSEALLHMLSATVIIIAYLMLVVSLPTEPQTWLAPSWLTLLTVAVFLIHPRHAKLAAMLFTFGLFVLVSIETFMFPSGNALYLLWIVVGTAAVAIGPSGGFAAAIASTALVIFSSQNAASASASPDVRIAFFLVWANAGLAWLAHRSLYTVLSWAWYNYQQSRKMVEELRDRQGALNRTLKSLNQAYDRLELLNDELAHARQVAEEARRLKAEFAANVSHELRTPLNLIIGFTEMMVMAPEAYGGQPLPSPYRSDLHAVYSNAGHLSNLIDDILELSQVEAGRMGLVRERVELPPIVDEAVRVVTPLFKGKGLTLDVDLPGALPSILIDRTRVRQVLINLLNNAARFTDRGGASVRAWLDANDIVLSVLDTGVGIPTEELPRIFEEFHQVDHPGGHRRGGSGLGLTICKRFVEMHGGSMWAESRPDQGTVFYFTLPIMENVVASLPTGEWQIWERHQKSQPEPAQAVLTICDDPTVARMFQRYLDGWHVHTVPNIAEAQSLLADVPVQGLIVAAPSPQDSLARLQEINANLKDLPIAICSIPGSHDLHRELGAAAYLVKPVTRASLLATLARLGRPVRSALVVDDEPEVVQMLGRMLRSAANRPRVRYAYSGKEAMATLSGWRPDIVLLDLLMPGGNGFTVLDWMRSVDRLRNIQVIVISAKGAREEEMRAGFVGITRSDGLSIRELMRYLEVGFEALR